MTATEIRALREIFEELTAHIANAATATDGVFTGETPRPEHVSKMLDHFVRYRERRGDGMPPALAMVVDSTIDYLRSVLKVRRLLYGKAAS